MAYIVLSIMVGVILENFSDVGAENRKITFDDIEDFREAWHKYDPQGTFVIESHNLLPVLQSARPPLGCKDVHPPMNRSQLLKLQGELNIPDHGGYVHFTECLTAISYHVSGVPVLPECAGTKRLQKYVGQVPSIQMLERPSHNSLTNYLVSMLAARYRSYKQRDRRSERCGAIISSNAQALDAAAALQRCEQGGASRPTTQPSQPVALIADAGAEVKARAVASRSVPIKH